MIALCSEYLSVRRIWLYVLVMLRMRFQIESILYSCLIVKELLPRSKREIWRWSDCNWTRTQNQLVFERTLNHLVKFNKWLRFVQNTYLYGAFDCMFLSRHVRVFRLNPHSIVAWLSRNSLLKTRWFCVRVQLQWLHLQISPLPLGRNSLTRNLKVNWLQLDSNPEPLSS